MTFLCSAFEEQKFLPSFVLLEKKPDNTLKVGQSMVSFKIEGVGKITKGQIMVWSANDEVDTSFVQQDHFLHTSLKAGSYSFQFYFNSRYNEIYSPITEIESGYHYTFALHFHQVELQIAEKPVIYLYPERLTKVSVSIETPAEISFVYPAFYKEKQIFNCTYFLIPFFIIYEEIFSHLIPPVQNIAIFLSFALFKLFFI